MRGPTQAYASVYSRTRGKFGANIVGIGAERLFYSDLSKDESERTLDDEITEHEIDLSRYINRLRNVPHACSLPSKEIAQAIVHLCIRVAHIREAFTEAALEIFDHVGTKFRDPSTLRKMLKLGDPMPSRMVRETIQDAFQKAPPNVRRMWSKSEFERQAVKMLRANFDSIMSEQMPLMHTILAGLQSQANDMMRQAHVKALQRGLVPALRVEALEVFDWTVRRVPDGNFVLPDCVAIALLTTGDSLPAVFADDKEIAGIVMPISHDQLVIGHTSRLDEVYELNRHFAICCWDFFVSKDQRTELDTLIDCVGLATRKFLEDAIAGIDV